MAFGQKLPLAQNDLLDFLHTRSTSSSNVLSDLALSFARNIGTRKNNLLCLFERLPVKDVVVVGMEITGSFFSQLKKINEPE